MLIHSPKIFKAPSLYSYTKPKANIIKNIKKTEKAINEFKVYIIEANGNIKIISKSKI